MKKLIRTTLIDTGGHGYLSVSKKDFLLICEPKDISGYSGHNLTRIFLEEDSDASLFMTKSEQKGFRIIVKDGYNLGFKIHHNYNPDLFNYIPRLYDIVNKRYNIVSIDKKRILIKNENDTIYKISLTNPFKFIDTIGV